MSENSRLRVLCVDDDPNVLEGLTLHLRRRYEVATAVGALAALELIRRDGPPAIVISDMRMPVMNGAALLAKVRELHPDTMRILLTGQADIDSAIAAINEGQIFRFLTKPCPPPLLLAAVDAAAEQRRLLSAERDLLEQTLHGSIRLLVDVLALTNPASFGRAMRVKTLVTELAEKLGMRERWQVEVAAMLSQLGWVTVPAELADKVHDRQPLTEEEQATVARLPTVTEQLLGNIPRLEVVRGILARHLRTSRVDNQVSNDERQLIFQGAQLLQVATDFDQLEASGITASAVIATMRERTGQYPPAMVDALAALRGPEMPRDEVRELPLKALIVGMVLASDLKLTNGKLLVARGDEITNSFLERCRHFRPGLVEEPVRVLVRARKRAPSTLP